MRWFFRRVNLRVFSKSVMETLCFAFVSSLSDSRGHVTSSLKVDLVRYIWTEKEMEYFLQVIKEKNITFIILDSKQTKAGEI